MALAYNMADVVSVLFLLEEDEETPPVHDDVVILAAASAALIRDKRPKIPRYVDAVVPQYLPDQFKRFFRISRETFEILLQHISNVPAMARRRPEAGRSQISNEKALLMTMWYLGSQETVRSISDRFDVQESTFISYNRRILKLFTEDLSKRFITLPKNDEHHEITRAFQMKKNFPGTFGAIDGTHIRIKPPVDREADYINRKGFHSITLQAVSREDGRFVDVFCGWPGRVNDARIFRTSPLSQILPALCGPYHIIGDGGYPLSRCLLTPYRDNGHLTAEQRLYNNSLSGTRVIIENCFCRLKGMFRRLQHVNMNDVENIVNVVVTTCCLHNICFMNNDELDDFFEEDIDNDFNINVANVFQPQNAEGTLKRLLITQQIAAGL